MDIGPHFYSVLSDHLIKATSDFFEHIKSEVYCVEYDAEAIDRFAEKYGSLVYRMIDLSDYK